MKEKIKQTKKEIKILGKENSYIWNGKNWDNKSNATNIIKKLFVKF